MWFWRQITLWKTFPVYHMTLGFAKHGEKNRKHTQLVWFRSNSPYSTRGKEEPYLLLSLSVDPGPCISLSISGSRRWEIVPFFYNTFQSLKLWRLALPYEGLKCIGETGVCLVNFGKIMVVVCVLPISLIALYSNCSNCLCFFQCASPQSAQCV